jgi:hypothetical protein
VHLLLPLPLKKNRLELAQGCKESSSIINRLALTRKYKQLIKAKNCKSIEQSIGRKWLLIGLKMQQIPHKQTNTTIKN